MSGFPKIKYLLPVAYMILILISSSIPMEREIKGIEFVMRIDARLQNLLHIPIFGLLAFLWIRSFSELKYSIRKTLFLSSFISLIYGIFDESYQLLIPGRYSSVGDIVLNFMGIIAGDLAGIFFYRTFKASR